MLPLLLATILVVPVDPSVLTIHPPTLQEQAVMIGTAHGLKVDRFLKVIECESGWNPNAVGDNGTSFGLAQLHRPTRDWGLTIEEAKDPEIAMTVMAKAWVRGEASRWTCWRNLYGK